MTHDERHDGITCAVCHDPILPIDYWAALLLTSARDDVVASHYVCYWSLTAPVE